MTAPSLDWFPSLRRVVAVALAVLSTVASASAQALPDGARWALLAVDVRDGRVLASHDPGALLVPASSLKIFTAAVALRRLGRGHRWRTRLMRDGDAIVLEGSGDPTLSTAALQQLAAASPSGIRELRLDTHRIYDVPYGPGWAWDDLTAGWSPPLGALGVDENAVRVRFTAALTPGAPPRVTAVPPDVLTFAVDAVSGRPDQADTLQWTRRLGTDTVDVSGTLPQGTAIDDGLAVSDGSAYVAKRLLAALGTPGLAVTRGTASSAASLVAEAVSAPLHEAVRHMLKESDNYYAEQMLRTLGASRGGHPADSGLEAAAAELTAMGVVAGTYRQVDGSGLSRYDLVRPRQLVAVLRAMAQDVDFVDALPVAGVDGTLVRRFLGSRLRGRLHAKTGSMSGVSALAGYLCDESGRPIVAFALMVNGALGSVKAFEEATLERVLPR